MWVAEQDFERGHMLWREDDRKVYVLYDDGRWERYDDTWHEGDAEFTCGTRASPPTPKCGFGKVWCTHENVRQGLENATNSEWGDDGALQDFGDGLIPHAGDREVHILFGTGNWIGRGSSVENSLMAWMEPSKVAQKPGGIS